MTKVFFFDLKAGQCSSVVEARLLRFWQAKNVKRGGELMWMDLLMVDFNVSYSFYHSRYNLFFHIYIYIDFHFVLCYLWAVSWLLVLIWFGVDPFVSIGFVFLLKDITTDPFEFSSYIITDRFLTVFQSTMMQVTIGAGRLPQFRDRLHAGTMFFVSGFDVSRCFKLITPYILSDRLRVIEKFPTFHWTRSS